MTMILQHKKRDELSGGVARLASHCSELRAIGVPHCHPCGIVTAPDRLTVGETVGEFIGKPCAAAAGSLAATQSLPRLSHPDACQVFSSACLKIQHGCQVFQASGRPVPPLPRWNQFARPSPKVATGWSLNRFWPQ